MSYLSGPWLRPAAGHPDHGLLLNAAPACIPSVQICRQPLRRTVKDSKYLIFTLISYTGLLHCSRTGFHRLTCTARKTSGVEGLYAWK